MIGYLIVALCIAAFLNAHVHLSETHGGPESHAHASEIHVAHFESTHDSLDDAVHTSDATAVDIDSAVGSIGLTMTLDLVAIAAVMLFLLAVPFRMGYSLPIHATPHRSDPHDSPQQARAPPR